MEVGDHRHVMVTLSPGKRPIVREDNLAMGLVWTKAETLAPTRIQFPDRPVCSDSLYGIRYPSPRIV